MPSAVKITKEQVLQTAFKLVRKQGAEALSARKIAAALKCSTQPVYSSFGNMKELEQAVTEEAMKFVLETYLFPRTNEMRFFHVGMGYIEIAKQDKALFDFLFISGRISIDLEKASWPFTDEEFKEKVMQDPLLIGLDDATVRKVTRNLWIFTIGLTTLMSANPGSLSDEFIHDAMYEMGGLVLFSAQGGKPETKQ